MQKIDDIVVNTAKSTEEICANIKENEKNNYIELTNRYFWRENIPLNIIGGGPSLKGQIELLRKYRFEAEYRDYRYVMACGSVHDFLVENGIVPNWTVICDPDEIMKNYLTKKHKDCKYLIASQCHPKIFKYLDDCDVSIWHAGGYNFKDSPYGEDKVGIGGGCTVGTRAICIALGMGFTNLHLFGFDTCLDENFKHHAYDFTDETKESIGNITEIRLGGPEGRKFYVAGYMLGQLFDFQKLLNMYSDRMKITIHGDGLLSELMNLAKKEVLK